MTRIFLAIVMVFLFSTAEAGMNIRCIGGSCGDKPDPERDKAMFDGQIRMAHRGSQGVQYRLGESYYLKGRYGSYKFPPDYEEAYFWMLLGCNSDAEKYEYHKCSTSIPNVVQHLTSDQKAAVEKRVAAWEPVPNFRITEPDVSSLQVYAETGQTDALIALGKYYQTHQGRAGVINYAKALELYKQAAQQSPEKAASLVAQMYERNHTGIGKHPEEAYFWYNIAYRNEISRSSTQDNIARARDKNAQLLTPEQKSEIDRRAADWTPTPVPPYVTTETLLERANDGDTKSAFLFAFVSEKKQAPNKERDVQIEHYYLKAAKQGFKPAQIALAQFLFYGGSGGTRRDRQEAYFWLCIALNPHGDKIIDLYASPLNKIANTLSPEQVNAIKSRVKNWKPD